MSFKSRILNILFWSVIAAAFIGPGTVTTATKAGANFGFDLLWALLFSTFACLLLQEASARITITSGLNLGQAIARHYKGKSTRMLILILVIGAIIIGCAAYETGNILGAISGLVLIFDISPRLLVIIMGAIAIIALNLPTVKAIANFMGFIVLLMGIAFFTTAVYLQPSINEIAKGAFIPKIPENSGAGLLVLGLIGTTVVPYDIFLGSGVLDKKQRIGEMRFGLSVAVILGGIISMAILCVGTILNEEFLQNAFLEGKIRAPEFSFDALALAITNSIGGWAVYIFGFGMFAAGFSSSITAPLASALTAKSLFETKQNKKKWDTRAVYFRLVWLGVLITGLSFGMAGVKPIPAIIIAQALNGFILPFISIFLIFVINNPKLMGNHINSWISNILMGIVVWITLILGLTNILKTVLSVFNLKLPNDNLSFIIISGITFLISAFILFKIHLLRRNKSVKA